MGPMVVAPPITGLTVNKSVTTTQKFTTPFFFEIKNCISISISISSITGVSRSFLLLLALAAWSAQSSCVLLLLLFIIIRLIIPLVVVVGVYLSRVPLVLGLFIATLARPWMKRALHLCVARLVARLVTMMIQRPRL